MINLYQKEIREGLIFFFFSSIQYWNPKKREEDKILPERNHNGEEEVKEARWKKEKKGCASRCIFSPVHILVRFGYFAFPFPSVSHYGGPIGRRRMIRYKRVVAILATSSG